MFDDPHPNMHVAQACIQIADFIKGLDRHHKVMLSVGGLSLRFDHENTTFFGKDEILVKL